VNGPLLIAYDATPASERALRAAAELLAGRPALVLVVWKAGLAFEAIELPAASIGLPPAPLDVRTALESEERLYEGARRAAEHGAAVARELGLDAEPLVVADDPDTPVAETIVGFARERGAQAIAAGSHAHGPIVGSIVRGLIREAPCPVLVVRERDGAQPSSTSP
jgi:nucleotide-binding universal stress UspA family protein